ncbi:MAG: penicillin acylase family protein [bacterium]
MNKRICQLLIAVVCLLASGSAVGAGVEKKVLNIPGLKAEVTVKYDNYGIPHIKASSNYDLFFAQGYIQASDRLWQMDCNRREANGKKAEMFGQGAVGHDVNVYMVGLPQVSQKIWETAEPWEREAFQAYADGVNAYIAGMTTLPEEYTEIGAKPELWSPVDSFAIGRSVSWMLSSALQIEIALGILSKTIGKTALMRLIPFDGVDPITITQWNGGSGAADVDGAVYSESGESSFPAERFDAHAAAALQSVTDTLGHGLTMPVFASNNWVVSGKRTAGGAPLLSDDMHMGMPNPAIWYEFQLESPEFNVVGMTFPGTPGLMVGHNGSIAWGVTTAMYDVLDVYVEKPDPQKPETNYIYKGESLPYTEEKVEIRYKTPEGMKSETRTIKHTIHGPMISIDRLAPAISFRWTGHEPTHEGRAFFKMFKARNLVDFKKALADFEVGAMNFVYADVDGNIYYRGQGKVPIRKGTPYLPLDGSSGKYEWTGYIPYDELPHAENPPEGYIASANNRQVDKKYPYYLGIIFDKGWRARRITDLLKADDKMTPEKMHAIQADVYSLPGEKLTPLLYKAAAKHPELLSDAAKASLETLKKWDFQESAQSVGPTILYKWLKHSALNIFKDDMPAEAYENIARPEAFFPFLLSEKSMPIDFYDDKTTPDTREDKDYMLAKSLTDAVVEIEGQLGADQAGWQWGRLHKITLGHTLGGKYNIGPEESDGGMDTVNVADFGLLGGNFNFGHAPTQRFTAELKPGAVSGVNVIPGGQSGDRNSPHYKDQFPMWLTKKTRPMYYTAEEVDKAMEKIVILQPKQ